MSTYGSVWSAFNLIIFFPFPTSPVYTPLTPAQAQLLPSPDLLPPLVPS